MSTRKVKNSETVQSKSARLYCSLDIETSGFDPEVNEILEVGFAFFKVEKKGIKITEEWTQVFKPTKPVSSNILGLTGISQEELDSAPKFSEFQNFLQEKLGDVVIVGHNINFDIRFLESFGIKFSGKTVDTLDLVQFLLPTHHSYNLENLMHTFQISHKEAHRALADSKAALKLLEKLLQIYSGFPVSLKKQITKLIKPFAFEWEVFLDTEFSGISFNEFSGKDSLNQKSNKINKEKKYETNTIYNFGLDTNILETSATTLSESSKKSLLIVPKFQQVLDLWKKGLADDAVFSPENLFSKEKFSQAIAKEDLTSDEVRFLIKVLVWQNTNWQTKTILDLNLSFFGGQFKSLITGGEIKENKAPRIIACDLNTFFSLSEKQLYKSRHLVLCGLNDFEQGITANIGTKTSWGYLNYLLKSFYNPEFNTGNKNYSEVVTQCLSDSDLFFGLTSALLQADPPGFMYFKINSESQKSQSYLKIKISAENFAAKLIEVNKVLLSKEIERFANNLVGFFQSEVNRVKWIELSESRCAFVSMPLEISNLVKETLSPFNQVSFVDGLGAPTLVNFFAQRLGLSKFKQCEIKYETVSANKKSRFIQGDLFSGIKESLGYKQNKINYYCWPQALNSSNVLDILKNGKGLPAAVLFPNPLSVREFYESNYLNLKQFAALLVQTNSGGSNKIFRNFSIHPNSLLLATDKFILKAVNAQSVVEQVYKLPVSTLIISRLPFEQFSHPYQEAISQSLPNAFMDYALPRALFNFHSLIKFFYTPALKDIYIVDSKLNKDYAKVFKEYSQYIPKAVAK